MFLYNSILRADILKLFFFMTVEIRNTRKKVIVFFKFVIVYHYEDEYKKIKVVSKSISSGETVHEIRNLTMTNVKHYIDKIVSEK